MTRNKSYTRSRRKQNSDIAVRTHNPAQPTASSSSTEPRIRAVIEGVKPEIDCGRVPIKRIVGDRVTVEADIFTDGHDAMSARLLFREQGEADWREAPMELLVNDRWRGAFKITALTDYFYTLEAWVDRFKSWRDGLSKKAAAKQDVGLEFIEGAELVALAAKRARGGDAETLKACAAALRAKEAGAVEKVLDEELAVLMSKHAERRWPARYDKELRIVVDRPIAEFSSWYEIFPRSCADQPRKHGTLRDCMARLPSIAELGFSVLYLPPIHPIGRSYRKGINGSLAAGPDDVGSPWAIGSEEGGHKSVHPLLGSLADFKQLVEKAREHDIEIALDIAYQCSPDHPYVREHPQWFRKRSDGTIQYAENPPKKYQDIYPLDFESSDWQSLWRALRDVFDYW